MSADFQRDYLVRLPLPLAQLYSRAYNDKSARSRHDNSYYLFEAFVKLAAAPLIATYLEEIDQGSARSKKVDAELVKLALPSLGQWVGMLRVLADWFGKRVDATSHPLGALSKELTRTRTDPGLLALYRRIKNGADGKPAGDQSCSLMELLDALVTYRNGVIGHGGPRFESFFATEMGPLLFPAVNEVFSDATHYLLGPKGSRLVYVTDINVVGPEQFEVGIRELVGMRSERAAPLSLTSAQARDLLPAQVAVLWPGRAEPVMLHPLMLFREGELADELLYLNCDRNGKQVEYLSYTTGRTERERTTVADLARLLARVVNRPVNDQDIERMAEESYSDSTSERQQAPLALAGQRRGDFEILAEIGHGGMGVVYLARQLSLGRLVALKMLPAELAGDEVVLARFRREMRAIGRCEHPNIVKILTSGTFPDGQMYYAMEYVPGADLDRVWRELTPADSITRFGDSTLVEAVRTASQKQQAILAQPQSGQSEGGDSSLPLETTAATEVPRLEENLQQYSRRIATLMRDAALAVHAVHEQNIIHRDIKPANLMLTPDASRVVLMDFGLAKGLSDSLTQTNSGGFVGSWRYAAPEQLAAATLRIGPAADVRALGVTLWELLTRRRLFAEAQDEKQLAQLIHERDVPLLRQVDPRLDRDLEAIVARATERQTVHRIDSAARLAEYLQLYLDGKPLPIRPPTAAEVLGRWALEHKPIVGAAAAICLAVLTLAVVVRIQESRHAQAQHLARVAAEEAAAEAERNLYTARMNFTQLAWQDGEMLRVQELLDETKASGEAGDLRNFEWYYWKRVMDSSLQELKGHTDVVTSVAFSSDGARLVSGSYDQSVKLWDLRTLEPPLTLEGRAGGVHSVAFRGDGKQVASANFNGTIHLWDATKLKEPIVLKGHTGNATCVAYSSDSNRVASTSVNNAERIRLGEVKIWNAQTGEALETFANKVFGARCVAFHPDGSSLAFANAFLVPSVHLWKPPSTELAWSSRVDFGSIDSLSFHPDGQLLASGGSDGTVRLWDANTGERQRTLNAHTAAASCVTFSPRGQTLVSAGQDQWIRWWDPVRGRKTRSLNLHKDAVTCVALSPDGKRQASAGQDKTIKLWSLKSSLRAFTLKAHAAEANCVIFSPDSKHMASCGGDRTVRIWDVASGRAVRIINQEAGADSIAYSKDGKRLAVSGKSIAIYDSLSGKVQRTLEGQNFSVKTLAFSPNGSRLAAGDSNWIVKVWNAVSGKQQLTLEGQKQQVTCVAFSPDGARLVSAGLDNVLRVRDAQTGREQFTLKGHQGFVTSFVFSADSKTLISGSWDRTLKVWDLASRQVVRDLRGHTDRITSVALSADGRRVASGSWDGTVRIWDLQSGQQTLTLKDHTDQVLSVSFSPDGKRLASADKDGYIKIWDTRPWTPEVQAECEGRDVIHALRKEGIPTADWPKSILADATLSEPVRERALKFARDFAVRYYD